MILIFDPAGLLPPDHGLTRDFPSRVTVREWRDVERLAPLADCSVIVPAPGRGWSMDDLDRFLRRFPLHPTVLVTRRIRECAPRVRRIAPPEAAWPREVDGTLSGAIWRAIGGTSLAGLAVSLGASAQLPPALRAALVHACRADPPFHCLAELARLVGCHPTTLCRQWNRTLGAESSAQLADFLGLILLIRSSRRRMAQGSLETLAADLRISEPMLRRLLRRWVDEDARHLPVDSWTEVGEALGEFARSPLLPPGALIFSFPADEHRRQGSGDRRGGSTPADPAPAPPDGGKRTIRGGR